MMEGMKKFGRALRRDHLPLVPPGLVLGGALGTFGTALLRGTLALASSVSALVAIAIVTTMGWAARYVPLCKKSHLRLGVKEHKGIIQNIDLLGPGSKLHTIGSTQKLIDSLTKKYRTAGQLPPKLQKCIDAHIGDAAEAGKHVRASCGGEELREVEFLRTVFNPMGQMQEVPVGKIAVLHTATPDETQAREIAAAAAKAAQGAQAASAIHAGSGAALAVKTIKLKKPAHKRRLA